MKSKVWISAVLALGSFSVFAHVDQGVQTIEDGRGFAIVKPAGWDFVKVGLKNVYAGETRDPALETPNSLANLVAGFNKHLPTSTSLKPTVTVNYVPIPQEIMRTADLLQILNFVLDKKLPNQKSAVILVKPEMTTVHGAQAGYAELRVLYKNQLDNRDAYVRVRDWIFPTKSGVYTVGMVCDEKNFAEMNPDFQKIINTVTLAKK